MEPKFDRFQYMDLISEGSAGYKYLARDEEKNRYVVIKNITDERIKEGYLINKDRLKSINHENLILIEDVLCSDDKCLIVEQHSEGVCLQEFVSQNDLSLYDFISIAKSVACGLKYLKSFGLTHRDIKPSNILYNKASSTALIIDFDYLFAETKSYSFIGTLCYAAPEQIVHNVSSDKSDIYSLGLVLCFLLNADLSFDHLLKNRTEKIFLSLEESLSSVLGKEKIFGKRIMDLIRSTLAYYPKERISIDEFLFKIEELSKTCIMHNSCGIIIGVKKPEEFQELAFARSALISVSLPISGEEPSRSPREKDVSDTTKKSQRRTTQKEKTNADVSDVGHLKENAYRRRLEQEYDNILFQAKISFWLWVFSFVMFFIIIAVAIVFVFFERYLDGGITALAEILVYGAQRLFKIREDQYRKLVEDKMKHLERIDLFSHAMDGADKITDGVQRNKKISDTVDSVRVAVENL